MKRLERALRVLNLEMGVLGFRNTLIRVVSPGSLLEAVSGLVLFSRDFWGQAKRPIPAT